MNKKTKNIIKVVIVFLMAGAVALSALVPIFASEKEDSDARWSNIQRIMSEIRGEKIIEKDEVKERITERRKELAAKREAISERVLTIHSNLDEVLSTIQEAPSYRERKLAVRGVPSGFSFQYDLRERARGDAVRYLQIVLNADPSTRVASSGWGSPGRETDLFGENTRKALIKFQRKHGISATGFFGLQSRVKANQILRDGVTVREVVEKDTTELRNRLLTIREMIKELVADAKLIRQEEQELEETTPSEQDIEDAQNYAREQEICTMEVREMKANGLTYTAKNGCEIEFLKNRGWE